MLSISRQHSYAAVVALVFLATLAVAASPAVPAAGAQASANGPEITNGQFSPDTEAIEADDPRRAGPCVICALGAGTGLGDETIDLSGSGLWHVQGDVHSNGSIKIEQPLTVSTVEYGTVKAAGTVYCSNLNAPDCPPARTVNGAAQINDPNPLDGVGIDSGSGAWKSLPNNCKQSHKTCDIEPGKYRGPFPTIQGTLRLAPGDYVFDRDILTIEGRYQHVPGTESQGVTLHFRDRSGLVIADTGALHLSAPRSGKYSGVIVNYDDGNTTPLVWRGSNNEVCGTVHAPDASLQFAADSEYSTSSVFIAKTITNDATDVTFRGEPSCSAVATGGAGAATVINTTISADITDPDGVHPDTVIAYWQESDGNCGDVEVSMEGLDGTTGGWFYLVDEDDDGNYSGTGQLPAGDIEWMIHAYDTLGNGSEYLPDGCDSTSDLIAEDDYGTAYNNGDEIKINIQNNDRPKNLGGNGRYRIIVPPKKGVASEHGTGNGNHAGASALLRYQTFIGAQGSDFFIYEMCSADNTAHGEHCDQATVWINILPTDPTARPDYINVPNNGTAGGHAIAELRVNDTINNGTQAQSTIEILDPVNPEDGAIEVLDDGRVEFTGRHKREGETVTVRYRLCDRLTLCDVSTVTFEWYTVEDVLPI